MRVMGPYPLGLVSWNHIGHILTHVEKAGKIQTGERRLMSLQFWSSKAQELAWLL